MSMRVLIFDDDLVRMPSFLAEPGAGASLHYRAHADDAEADVSALQPHLVLMDYSMGAARSGVQAVAALRARWSATELPIWGISSDDRANRFMILAGANGAVTKMALPDLLPRLLADFAPSPPSSVAAPRSTPADRQLGPRDDG